MTSTWQMPLFLMESEESHVNPIEGFSYHEEFISPDDEGVLIKYADSNPWDTTWKRRNQQYGYGYGTSRRESLGGMPEWLSSLCTRLREESIFIETPNKLLLTSICPDRALRRMSITCPIMAIRLLHSVSVPLS